MKKLVIFIGVIISLSGFAQQSTTGPTPPEGTDRGLSWRNPNSTVVISGVPCYLWFRGCGPTSLGMVVGYYDTHGFPDLMVGDGSTQTTGANNAIATSEHFIDYSLPKDYYPNLQLDKSSLGGAHSSNCLADFMKTSWSSQSNYWGWSWSSDVDDSFNNYVNYINSNYFRSSQFYYFNTGSSWNAYKNEINNNRPVVLLVDSNGDGYTDHFVTGIGYDDVNNLYAIYDTWDNSIHWYQWRAMSSSYSWGIYNFSAHHIKYVIDASANPSAGGTTSGDGNFYNGETVNLQATANSGYSFVNWTEGGTPVSTNNNYSFTASANRTLVANFIVTPTVPTNRTVQNVTVNSGESNCYDATNTISVAGSGTTVNIYANGTASFIAGEKIVFNPGFKAYPGSYVTANIATTSNYCSQQAPMVASGNNGNTINITSGKTESVNEKTLSLYKNNVIEEDLRIYPNPAKDVFYIETTDYSGLQKIVIYNLMGKQVYSNEKIETMEFSIRHVPSGIYAIHILYKDKLIKKKLIKTS